MNNVFRRKDEHSVQIVKSNVNKNENIVQRLAMVSAALRLRNKADLAKKLGIGRTTLYYIENGESEPSKQFVRSLNALEQEMSAKSEQYVQMTRIHVTPSNSLDSTRQIPVLGWAHAGDAMNYDEIPESWQERVPTECRDPKAFAIRLEGESMKPEYAEGDLLIVQPSEEIYNGCLAVIKMRSDGYIFRRVELRPAYLRMIPLNPQWACEDLPRDQIAWAYPVWGMWRQVWKR